MTAEIGPGLGRELGLLEASGLISLAATTPELEYLFRHVLIQDAAYESLLKQERRTLHRDVAEALLALRPEHQEDLAPVLAHHFERAEDRPRAIEFLVIAAERARARFARHEAVEFARRAAALLPDGDEVDGDARRLRAQMLLLQAEAGNDFVPLHDTLALLDRVIADAETLDDPELGAGAHLLIAVSRSLSGEQYASSPELERALRRATQLAAESGSPELIAMGLSSLGYSRYAASEFPEAIEIMERAVPALVDAGQLYVGSMTAGHLGTAYGHVGDFDKAVAWTDRAYELGVESGDPNASLDADLARSIIEGIRGNSAAAIDYATKAATVAARVDNKACAMVAHGVIGEQYLRDGDPSQAAIAFEASAELATFCQFMPVKIEQTELLLQTARSQAGVGRVEFERYERALELARQFGDRLAEAQLHEQRARDRIAAGQSASIAADLDRASELFEALGAAAHLARIVDLRASLAATTPG